MMKLVNQKGETVSLGPEIGHGGEGTIHLLDGRPDLVAKIYTHSKQETTDKLLTMLSVKPTGADKVGGHVSICWPQDVLFSSLDRQTQPAVGFVMQRFDSKTYREFRSIYHPNTRRIEAPLFTWRYLVNAAANVAGVVQSMHKSSCIIGDINESNFFISDSALITLIDCDSAQVPRFGGGCFYCEVSKPQYLAPELHDKDLKSYPRTESSDNFGLAVLIFLLLMEGNHPFRIKKSDLPPNQEPPELEDLIKAGEYPYDSASHYHPPRVAPPYDLLPLAIRKLCSRAFRDGVKDPSLRPTAAEWKATLEGLATSLRECKKSKLHVYPTHLNSCPWCQRAADLGYDSFPKSVPQKPLPRKPFGPPSAPVPPKPSAGFHKPASPQSVTPPYTPPAVGTRSSSQPPVSLGPPTFGSAVKGPPRILLVPVVIAVISFLVFFAIAFSRHLYLVQVRFATYIWMSAAVTGVCLNVRRRQFPRCLGNLAQFFGLTWLIQRYDGNLLPVMLASASGIFFCARSLILLFENKFRRVSTFAPKRALILATTLSATPIFCVVLLLTAQELRLGPSPPPNVPIVEGVAPAHLLVCATLQKLCSCQVKNTLQPGETAYIMLTSPLTPPTDVTVSYADSAPQPIRFGRTWHRGGQLNCMSTPLPIPESASGFATIHASFGAQSKTIDERVPIAAAIERSQEAANSTDTQKLSGTEQAPNVVPIQSTSQTGVPNTPKAPDLADVEPQGPPASTTPVTPTIIQQQQLSRPSTDSSIPATPAFSRETSEVEETIQAWAAAIAANDVEKETSLFADTVNVNGYNGSRNALKQAKLQAISKGFRFKTFTIRDLLVTVHGQNNADVSLTRVWQSNKSNGQGRSKMTLNRADGQWRITSMTDR